MRRRRVVEANDHPLCLLVLCGALASGCTADGLKTGGGDGSAGGSAASAAGGLGFGVDRPPNAIVDGFALEIEKIGGGEIEISWSDQGVSTYEVWSSFDPYFTPEDAGSTMEASGSDLDFVDDEGTETYYRVFADGATEELSTTVGQLSYDLYKFYTKLGLCLVSEIDTWPELEADMSSSPSSASMWIAHAQGWKVPPALNSEAFGPGQVISVQHLADPTPGTYVAVGHVPTEADASIPLYAGNNLVTTLPFRFGPILASDLLGQVENATRVGRWDAATQTTFWYPDDGDWLIPPCSPLHLEVSAPSTWPPPPPENELPPDPAEVAPPIDATVTTRFYDSVSFLFENAPPIQEGVSPGSIDAGRAAVVRGTVAQRGGAALGGVTISVVDRPEFGTTQTRADGRYDLAVNGGGAVTLSFDVEGRLPAQRTVHPQWQTFVELGRVALVELDSAATVVDFADPIEMHEANEVTDADGTRTAVLLFESGTVATMVMPDQTQSLLPSITVRATEYTVGAEGPDAMPGDLPAASGYTYAVEYSVDEALAAGAERVTFDPPAIAYTDNFLAFPAGTRVPTGSYDRASAAWIPEPNGLVLAIISETAGLADVDLTGDGSADPSQYAAVGITDEERGALAARYDAGDEAWRVPIEHFSPWDHNFPWRPPDDAEPPPTDRPPSAQPDDAPCEAEGSILECQGQVLGERLNVVGTPFTLNYRSDRVPGRTASYTVSMQNATPGPLSPSLEAVRARLFVGGRVIQEELAATVGQGVALEWDGLDAYGRAVQGPQPAEFCLGYVYPAQYARPTDAQVDALFGAPGQGVALASNAGRLQTILWRCHNGAAVGGGAPFLMQFSQGALGTGDGIVLGTWSAQTGAARLGGWTLSVHHTLAPEAGVLYLGTGARVDGLSTVADTVAGGGGLQSEGAPALSTNLVSVQAVAAAPDGSLYVSYSDRVRRITADGIINTIAGTGTAGFSGDGGAGPSAQIDDPQDIAVGPDGGVYIADWGNNRVRRVDPDGTISTFAGDGGTGDSGDGGQATAADVRPLDVAVGPDGTVYITHFSGFTARIRRVTPDGTIDAFAGGTCTSGPLEGKAALGDCFTNASGLAIAGDGSLYLGMEDPISAFANTVYRITPNGVFERVAGGGSPADGLGDGLAATEAELANVRDVAVAADGRLYIAEAGVSNHIRVRLVSGGVIDTLTGTGSTGTHAGDGGPAGAARFPAPQSIALGPDHALYVAAGSASSGRIRRVSLSGPGFATDQIAIMSDDHTAIYAFDQRGRHLSTVDAITGALVWTFGYDGDGHLVSVTDAFNDTTTIERGSGGDPIRIVAPDGQQTVVTLSASGWLETVANPESETYAFEYTPDGLLTSITTPELQEKTYTYDGGGLLIRADDPEGGSKSLARTDLGNGAYEVSLTTELGRVSTYRVEREPGGIERRTNTAPDGTSVGTVNGTDGVSVTTFANGAVLTTAVTGDPRFGMDAPLFAAATLTTPSGRELERTLSVDVTLADEESPTSMTDMTATTTVNGRPWTWSWSTANSEIQLTSPEGRGLTMVLDGNGQVDLLQPDGLSTIDYDHDARGRPITITIGQAPTLRQLSYSYGTDGLLDGLIDPLGRTHGFARDLVGRIVEHTRPDAELTSLDYDDNGNIVGVAPPSRPQHGFSYDGRDRVASYDPPSVPGAASPSTTYDRTLDHELERITRPDGQEIEAVYEAGTGRLLTLVTPLGTYGVAYDAEGRVDVLSDPDGGTLTYGYDGPLLLSEAVAGDVGGTVSWTYDDDLRVASASVNGGSTTTLDYDDDGLVISASDATIVRDAANGLTTGITVGSVSTTLAHSEFAELIELAYFYGGATLFDAGYVRNAGGQVDLVEETVEGVARDVAYTYDLGGRLETVSEDGILIATYEYDANGNRTAVTASGSSLVATYDDQDRLLSFADLEFDYSAAGELISRTDTVTGDTTIYDYDVVGDLRSVDLPDGTLIEYVVDARGRRVGKRVDGIPDRAWLYSGQETIVAELDDQNAVVSRFVQGSSRNAPLYMVRGGVTYRLVTDQLGSVRLVVDVATGVVAQRLDYDAWGLVLADTNPGFQPFGFAGGLYDPDTGLVHFGAREYDPEIGRWTSKEPLGFLGASSFYLYAHGDPINWIDPTGLLPEWVDYDSMVGLATSSAVAGFPVLWAARWWWTPRDVIADALGADTESESYLDATLTADIIEILGSLLFGSGRFAPRCSPKDFKRGPKGARKHKPGRGKDRKSQSQKKKRFQKKAQAKAEAKAEAKKAAEDVWESFTPEQQKLFPELDPSTMTF